MRDHSRFVAFILIAAAFAVSALAFPNLPLRVPTHWGLSGQADGFSGRLTGAFLMPAIMLTIWIVLIVIPRYDRALFIRYKDRGTDSSTAQPIYNVIIVAVLAMLLAIHVFAITSALGLVGASRQPVLIAAIASLGCIVIGNYMPRVTRRNAFVGFRVPWAYASEEVWRRTQRARGLWNGNCGDNRARGCLRTSIGASQTVYHRYDRPNWGCDGLFVQNRACPGRCVRLHPAQPLLPAVHPRILHTCGLPLGLSMA